VAWVRVMQRHQGYARNDREKNNQNNPESPNKFCEGKEIEIDVTMYRKNYQLPKWIL